MIKGSFQKARVKVEKHEEEPHQGMAIRGIANIEKRKKEEAEKSKVTSTESLNPESRTRHADRLEPQDDKVHQSSIDTTPIPEVFDSSKYDSMTEMKESAEMKEGGHLKEVLTSVEKEEPVKPSAMDAKPSSMTNSPSAATTPSADVDASTPNLEEKAAALRGSKDEQIEDRNIEDSKDKSGEVIEAKDKEAYAEQHQSQDAAKSWNDFYIEYARNASEITKSWLDLFSSSWLFGYKRKKQ
jgi:hypothetical protein